MNRSESTVSQQGMELFLSVHFSAFRAVSCAMEQVSVYAINTIFRPHTSYSSFEEVGTGIADVRVVDYSCTVTRVVAHKFCIAVVGRELFSAESLMTRSRRRKAKEIAVIRERLGEESPTSKFSRHTAQLVTDIFPIISSDQLFCVPPILEQHFLYRSGLAIRYVNYKIINEVFDYRTWFLDSTARSVLEKVYCSWGTNLSSRLLGPSTVSHVVDVEFVLLKIFSKIHEGSSSTPLDSRLGDVVIKSFAQSIALMQDADAFLDDHEFMSNEEAFIARLHWYKRNHALPEGAPDPDELSLNIRNLETHLDEALSSYLEELAEIVLNQTFTKMIKSQFLYGVYLLEGKNALKKLLAYLLRELVVKQFSDPHLFVQAILFAQGVDTCDYDLEGFGRGKSDVIFRTGQQLCQQVVSSGGDIGICEELYYCAPNILAFEKIYQNAHLKPNPGSYEGIMQKCEAKERLKQLIFEIIYDAIKPQSYRSEGQLKDLRESLSELPLLGIATTSLHVLINGLYYSLSYLAAEEGAGGFISHLLRGFTGKKVCQSLANRIIDIIYHPGWHLVILQFIESLKESLLHDGEAEPSTVTDMRVIVSFMFQHLSQDLSRWGAPVESLFDWFVSDEVLIDLKASLKPSSTPFLETLMESALPSLEETILISRVTKIFRENYHYFDGDHKLWELFVREWLNRLVFSAIEGGTLLEQNEKRREFLTILLAYNRRQLWDTFARVPDIDEAPLVHQRLLRDIKIVSESGPFCSSASINWDYLDFIDRTCSGDA